MKLTKHTEHSMLRKGDGVARSALTCGILAALLTVSSAAETQPKPADFPASRFVSADDLPDFIQKVSAVLTMRSRANDPFGQPQDPAAKPVVKAPVGPRTTYAAQATPFSELIRLIKITTVMPTEKRFLIGTRSIRQGDQIPLSYRGSQIKVEVADVTSASIEFRNVDSGEKASIPLNLLPAGMNAGGKGISAPGMVPNIPNAPIDLDAGSF